MRSAEPSSGAPVRAAGLVLTLFATAAGAAGAATLSSAPQPSETQPVVLASVDDIAAEKAFGREQIEQRADEVRAAAEAEEARVAAATRAQKHAQRVAMWDTLADCETGGDWYDGGEYGGGLGIYVGTWQMYGGREFAVRPQWATKAEQIIIAERIALDGYGGWGCARTLGWVN
ncbi:MAG: transglycosylase family protein [Acidimicrobiia bacterium]